MSKLSIQMYTVRESMNTREDFLKTLGRIYDIGYRIVQIRTPQFMTSKETADALKNAGLAADSALCNNGDDIFTRIPDAVAEAHYFGTDMVRTDSIPMALRGSADGYRSFAVKLNEAGKAFKKEGLKFTYHFHAFEYINFPGETGMEILLRETDPACVYFQPDVFWMAAAGKEPSRALLDYKGRCTYIHLKDYAVAAAQQIVEKIPAVSAPVGEGNLCWPEILKTAKEIGVEYYVMEDDLGLLDPFDSAAISYRNLKKMGLGE